VQQADDRWADVLRDIDRRAVHELQLPAPLAPMQPHAAERDGEGDRSRRGAPDACHDRIDFHLSGAWGVGEGRRSGGYPRGRLNHRRIDLAEREEDLPRRRRAVSALAHR
jgi:hypothetical protein